MVGDPEKAPVEKHKYIELIEFTLKNAPSFTVQQARDATKLSPREFLLAAPSIFAMDDQQRDNLGDVHLSQNWVIKPEALFGYLQYTQYRHAIVSSRWAIGVAVAAMLLTAASLFVR